MTDELPVVPFRSTLYTPAELFDGFDPARPGSYAETLDLRTYRSTRGAPSRDVGMLRALHDQCITDARDALVDGRRVVAIMGGHDMARTDPAYREVARLARRLARAGALLTSGGGPGAMEATHLGARFAPCPDGDLDAALGALGEVPEFPRGGPLVRPDGALDAELLVRLHEWQVPAFAVAASVPDEQAGASLAVPTWFYGHEPPTPLATHLAKYFSNAQREDGLLAIAGDGTVFAPGKAGTLQEVFQDAAQNYYRVFHDRFSPMAFLDVGGCWSRTFPVDDLLRTLFGGDDHTRHVRRSADPDELYRFLTDRWSPPGATPDR